MGRPNSEGFTYFTHDVDMSSDEKIELLEARHGLTGYAIYNKLLERIFRGGGFFDISLKETLQVLASKFKVTEGVLDNIIASCIEFGLFDHQMFTKCILTSSGIAKRAKPLHDNRLNNREKQGKVVLTEIEKQFYNYIKIITKQKQKKGHSKGEESKGEESERNSDTHTQEGQKLNGAFDWKECTRQLALSDTYKPLLFKKYTWVCGVWLDEMNRFVLHIESEGSKKPPATEKETIARYEKFLLNSYSNPRNAKN